MLVELTVEQIDFIRWATHEYVNRLDGYPRLVENVNRTSLLGVFQSAGYDLTREVIGISSRMNDIEKVSMTPEDIHHAITGE